MMTNEKDIEKGITSSAELQKAPAQAPAASQNTNDSGITVIKADDPTPSSASAKNTDGITVIKADDPLPQKRSGSSWRWNFCVRCKSHQGRRNYSQCRKSRTK